MVVIRPEYRYGWVADRVSNLSQVRPCSGNQGAFSIVEFSLMNSLLGIGVAVALLTASCNADSSPDTRGEAESTSLPSTSTSVVTSTSSTSTTVASPTTSTPVEEAGFVFPLSDQLLVYGREGVSIVDENGNAPTALPDPTAFAVAVGDSMVLTQEPEESDVYPPHRGWTFYVHRPAVEPALVAVSNRQLRLFDAGFVKGRPVALATLVNWAGQDTYEDLLLVDLDPDPSTDPGDMFTDLGRVGSWENLVFNAKLSGEVIVLATSGGIEARTLTGDLLWDGITDNPNQPFAVNDTELLVARGRFGEDFQPLLDIWRYELNTGELRSEATIELDAEFDGGFCLVVDWDGERLFCDESYGGPFAVDVETGDIEQMSGLDHGMPAIIPDSSS